jgi:hypothetical protein
MFHPKLRIKRNALVLQDATDNYAGRYSCIVTNQADERSFSIDVEVQSPPVIHVLQYLTDEGQTNSNQNTVFIRPRRRIKINCLAEGNPIPEIAWSKNGHILHGNKSLVLQNINRADEGFYTCRARNSEGQAFKSILLNLLSRPEYKKGDLMQYISASAGNCLTLDCSMTGHPTPSVQWFFNGLVVPSYFNHFLRYF